MLPNIDTVNNASTTGTVAAPQKRSDTDRAIQSIQSKSVEAYKSGQTMPDPAGAMEKTYTERRVNKIDNVAGNTEIRQEKDRVELNFSLSLEEKDAFINAFSNKQDPATMSKEEKDTLQSAAARISKFVEEAISKNTERREKVEKAVSEWYSRISRRELEGPFDLVVLLRKAASGQLDTLWE